MKKEAVLMYKRSKGGFISPPFYTIKEAHKWIAANEPFIDKKSMKTFIGDNGGWHSFDCMIFITFKASRGVSITAPRSDKTDYWGRGAKRIDPNSPTIEEDFEAKKHAAWITSWAMNMI
jgi:hypothetical protein